MKYIVIVLALWCVGSPAFAGGSDQLRIFMNSTLSARGTFTQSVVSSAGRKPKQSGGIFALQRPGKFRWSYEQPYPQLLVSDGQTLWSWDPELKQLVVKKLGQSLSGSPAALLSGGDLEKNFELKDAGAKDGLDFVEARPRQSDASFVLMRVGLAANLPVVMEIQDSFGQVTTLRFTRFEANPTLSADLFRFKAPAGVDVVSE